MSNSSLEKKWYGFGKYILIVSILWVFILIPYLAFGIIVLQFIFINLALNEIKKINRQLNNPNLEQFYTKCITGNIIKLIGLIILNIGAAMITGFFVLGPLGPFGPLVFLSIIILLIIGFIIMIIASSIEMRGWEELGSFFLQNKAMFPNKVAKDVIDGVDNLRSGTLSWALGFLIIPIIIGWIYQMVGYFKLATLNKLVPKKGIQPTPTPEPQPTPISELQASLTFESQPSPTSAQEPRDIIKFCPLCGAKIEQGTRFCGECGAQISD